MCCTLFMSVVAPLLLMLLNVRAAAAVQCTPRPSFRVSGRLLCAQKAIPLVHVVLEHKIQFVRNTIAKTQTREDGSFTLQGVPHFVSDGKKPTLSLSLEYFQSSDKANFLVSGGDDVEVELTGSDVNIGDKNLDTDNCGAYNAFYNATLDFYNRVGKKSPHRIVIEGDEAAPIDTPYVYNTYVVFKPGYVWTEGVARHEVAHVIRHVYDGDHKHFQEDAQKYGSPELRNHTCSTDSNEGFAFNEGWALYWEGECAGSDAEGAHTIEGNVAAALRQLEARCDSSAAQMWQVLEENAGSIHSFSEYESLFSRLSGCA